MLLVANTFFQNRIKSYEIIVIFLQYVHRVLIVVIEIFINVLE